jgi:hypothetical protein
MDQQPKAPDVKALVKEKWERPHYRSVDAKSAELGLAVGADLIILGTAS